MASNDTASLMRHAKASWVRLALIAVLWCGRGWGNAAWAQAEQLQLKLPAGAVRSQANGWIELRRDVHSPIYVAFDRSDTLSRALAAAIQAKGFSVTQGQSAAKAQPVIRGDLVLQGGPVFYKGVKLPMGDATEKTVKAAAEGRSTTPAEAAQAAVSLALESGAASSAVSSFWRGLALSRMADVLGDATGVRGAFNKALTGDPRGVCLSRCEDWKEVKQTAYAFVTLTTADGRREVRVLITANQDVLTPEEVIDEALPRAMAAVEVSGGGHGRPEMRRALRRPRCG